MNSEQYQRFRNRWLVKPFARENTVPRLSYNVELFFYQDHHIVLNTHQGRHLKLSSFRPSSSGLYISLFSPTDFSSMLGFITRTDDYGARVCWSSISSLNGRRVILLQHAGHWGIFHRTQQQQSFHVSHHGSGIAAVREALVGALQNVELFRVHFSEGKQNGKHVIFRWTIKQSIEGIHVNLNGCWFELSIFSAPDSGASDGTLPRFAPGVSNRTATT